MAEAPASVEEIARLARQLRPTDRALLIERVIEELNQDAGYGIGPRRELLGLWADLGSAPSADEIDAARSKTWGNLPRSVISSTNRRPVRGD